LRAAGGASPARALQHQPAKPDDGGIGRTEALARAVGDPALTVPDGGVLLGDATDAGEGPKLLIDAIEAVVVVAVADGNPVRVDLGVDALACLETRARSPSTADRGSTCSSTPSTARRLMGTHV